MNVEDVFAATRKRRQAYEAASQPWPPAGPERDAVIAERRAIGAERLELAKTLENPRERRFWMRVFEQDAKL